MPAPMDDLENSNRQSTPETGPALPLRPPPEDPFLHLQRAQFAADRSLSLVEMFFVSGILTDLLLVLLLAWLLGVDRSRLLQRPFSLFVYLLLSTAAVLGLIFFFQWTRRHQPELRLRFRPPGKWWPEVLLAVLSIPLLLATMLVLRALFAALLPDWAAPENPVLKMIETPADLALFLGTGIIAGGLREEFQRAFIIQRTGVYFHSPYVGLLVWSVIFGLEHAAQGGDAIFITAVLGIQFGLLFIHRRNIFLPFLSHALFNTAVLAIYWASR